VKKRGKTTDLRRLNRVSEREAIQRALRNEMRPEQWAELERITWERGRQKEAELLGGTHAKES
jgi:hypothetical protein